MNLHEIAPPQNHYESLIIRCLSSLLQPPSYLQTDPKPKQQQIRFKLIWNPQNRKHNFVIMILVRKVMAAMHPSSKTVMRWFPSSTYGKWQPPSTLCPHLPWTAIKTRREKSFSCLDMVSFCKDLVSICAYLVSFCAYLISFCTDLVSFFADLVSFFVDLIFFFR